MVKHRNATRLEHARDLRDVLLELWWRHMDQAVIAPHGIDRSGEIRGQVGVSREMCPDTSKASQPLTASIKAVR